MNIIDIVTNAVPFCVVISIPLTGVYLLMDWAREDKENEK